MVRLFDARPLFGIGRRRSRRAAPVRENTLDSRLLYGLVAGLSPRSNNILEAALLS